MLYLHSQLKAINQIVFLLIKIKSQKVKRKKRVCELCKARVEINEAQASILSLEEH